MKPQMWLPLLVFLAVSIPLVLILNALEIGGDYRVWIALIVGAIAMGFTQHKMKAKRSEAE